MSRWMLALCLLPACDNAEVVACTEIGCLSQLTLTVTGSDGDTAFAGTVTVGDHPFAVDCGGTSDPEVTCDGQTVHIQLMDGLGGSDVVWSLSTPDRDTGTGGGTYVGNGTFTPEWTTSQPNGPDCPPTCWTGSGTVELFGTP